MKAFLPTLIAASVMFSFAHAGDGWLTDMTAAKAAAKKENKLVLIDFTGSDWCPPCKKLTAEVLSTREFLDYAQKHYVLMEVDSPRSKPQSAELKAANGKLKSEFAIKGFPTLVVVTPDGKELGRKVAYSSGGPASVISELEAMRKKP